MQTDDMEFVEAVDLLATDGPRVHDLPGPVTFEPGEWVKVPFVGIGERLLGIPEGFGVRKLDGTPLRLKGTVVASSHQAGGVTQLRSDQIVATYGEMSMEALKARCVAANLAVSTARSPMIALLMTAEGEDAPVGAPVGEDGGETGDLVDDGFI